MLRAVSMRLKKRVFDADQNSGPTVAQSFFCCGRSQHGCQVCKCQVTQKFGQKPARKMALYTTNPDYTFRTMIKDLIAD